MISDLEAILNQKTADDDRLKPAVDGAADEQAEFFIKLTCIHAPTIPNQKPIAMIFVDNFNYLFTVAGLKTVYIEDDQHRRLKKLASTKGVSVQSVATKCISIGLAHQENPVAFELSAVEREAVDRLMTAGPVWESWTR